MTSLTDRYVWAVLRAVPQAKRAELEPEIRALVADAAEAHAGARISPTPPSGRRSRSSAIPTPSPPATPTRTRFLIGPHLYPEWERLLRLLLPIVVPIAGIAVRSGRVGLGQAGRGGDRERPRRRVHRRRAAHVLVHARVRDRRADRRCGRAADGPPVVARPAAGAPRPGPDEPRRGHRVGRVRGVRHRGDRLGRSSRRRSRSTGAAYPLFDPVELELVAVVRRSASWSRRSCSRSRSTCAAAGRGRLRSSTRSSPPRSRSPPCTCSCEDLLLNDELVAAVDAQTNGDWFAATVGITAVVIILIDGDRRDRRVPQGLAHLAPGGPGRRLKAARHADAPARMLLAGVGVRGGVGPGPQPIGRSWVRRMWLPDGSRKAASRP